MARWARSVGTFAVEMIYPKRCAGCGRRGTWLCSLCDAALGRFNPPLCDRCGVPVALDRCHCALMPEHLSRVRSVGPFAGWLRGAIVNFKYHGEWGRAPDLARSLATVAQDLAPFDACVPVPLHPSRLKQRGFNQSALLAEETAAVLQVDALDPLVRRKRTMPQVSLGAAQRRANVVDAFAVRSARDLAGLRIVLIDDVITTGSTLAACAHVLGDAGVASVAVATLAREM